MVPRRKWTVLKKKGCLFVYKTEGRWEVISPYSFFSNTPSEAIFNRIKIQNLNFWGKNPVKIYLETEKPKKSKVTFSHDETRLQRIKPYWIGSYPPSWSWLYIFQFYPCFNRNLVGSKWHDFVIINSRNKFNTLLNLLQCPIISKNNN